MLSEDCVGLEENRLRASCCVSRGPDPAAGGEDQPEGCQRNRARLKSSCAGEQVTIKRVK